MELQYASEKVEAQCTSVKSARKLFGGNSALVISLMARINSLANADTLKDIIVQPTFRFHSLQNKRRRELDGYFSIDVKTKKEPWRIILQPLTNDKNHLIPAI